MYSPTEEIKARVDIVELVQSYVRLQKAGVNYKANCPFHAEKTPSFYVSPGRQIWHCFGGCGEGGDIFKFIMKIEGLDFPEALKLLAGRAGVQLKKEDPALRSEKNRMYDCCEEATLVFEKSLSLTPAVVSYLMRRGVNANTIQEFRIGFAPRSWDFLINALSTKGFRKEEIERAGLAIKSDDRSSWYDRFRGRIMFPITDVNGRVIGFGGRIFEEVPTRKAVGTPTPDAQSVRDVGAKYINTPQTLIYDKSRVLYGFDKAKQEIRSKNRVVVVEGYMDCVMSYQAGIRETVAASGTALGSFQLQTLRRLCDTMISSFDADAAGESATKRTLNLAAQFGFARKIAAIPSGNGDSRISTGKSSDPPLCGSVEISLPPKDPADAVLENPQTWRDAIENAKDIVPFFFETAFKKYDSATPEGKKKISALLLPYLSELYDEIEKAHWVTELSGRLGVVEDSIWKELKKIGERAGSFSDASLPDREETSTSERKAQRRLDLLEERYLTLLFALRKQARSADRPPSTDITFTATRHQELFQILNAADKPEAALPLHLQELFDIFTMRAESLIDGTIDIAQELPICGRELEKELLRERLKTVSSEIQKKENAGDADAIQTLLRDFNILTEQLNSFSHAVPPLSYGQAANEKKEDRSQWSDKEGTNRR